MKTAHTKSKTMRCANAAEKRRLKLLAKDKQDEARKLLKEVKIANKNAKTKQLQAKQV